MKSFTMQSVTLFSLLALLICVWGFGSVLYNQYMPAGHSTKMNQLPVNQQSSSKGAYHVLALGDSLTRGTGDSTGKGYIRDLTGLLKTKSKRPIVLSNLAINGEKSEGLLKQMKQPEVKRQIKNADVILFTIGGDDLFNNGKNLKHFSKKTIQQDENVYLQHLNLIYQRIRSQNHSAVIYHIGLYNPFNTLKNGKATSAVVRKWNDDSAKVAAKYKNVVEVPIYDLFQRNVSKYLSGDHFHPNKIGYERIAKRLEPLLSFSKNGGK